MLYDLLVRHFHSSMALEARNPGLANIGEIAGSQEKADALADRGRAFLQDEGTKRAMQRILHGGTPEELIAKRAPQTIRIGGKSSTRPLVKTVTVKP